MNNVNEYEVRNALENDFFSARSLCPNSNMLDQLSTEYVLGWFEGRGEKTPDEYQAAAIGSMNKNVEIIARAGSGKTTAIVGRATFLINHCHVDPESILMLAFNSEENVTKAGQRLEITGDMALLFRPWPQNDPKIK